MWIPDGARLDHTSELKWKRSGRWQLSQRRRLCLNEATECVAFFLPPSLRRLDITIRNSQSRQQSTPPQCFPRRTMMAARLSSDLMTTRTETDKSGQTLAVKLGNMNLRMAQFTTVPRFQDLSLWNRCNTGLETAPTVCANPPWF